MRYILNTHWSTLPTLTASEKPLGTSRMPTRNQAGSNLMVFELPKHALHSSWYFLFSITLLIIASESLPAMKITTYLAPIGLTYGMSGLFGKWGRLGTPKTTELTCIRCSRGPSLSTKCAGSHVDTVQQAIPRTWLTLQRLVQFEAWYYPSVFVRGSAWIPRHIPNSEHGWSFSACIRLRKSLTKEDMSGLEQRTRTNIQGKGKHCDAPIFRKILILNRSFKVH